MTPGEKTVAAVDREPFIPGTIYVRSEDTGWLVPLHRDDDPHRWRALVDSDQAVVTAVGYDPRLPEHLRDPATGRGVMPTSSSSGRPVMARMLDALDLEPGMRVLEVGTGTGYNAALLAYIVGGGMVTSVESEPGLAEHARAALDTAGFHVDVVTGDGAHGHPPGAPYDRVVATAAVHTLPYAWVAQTRPGGVLVVPWAPTFHPDGPLAVLTVGEDGTACGRFVGPAHFMPLDTQRVDPGEVNRLHEVWEAEGVPDCARFGVTVTPQGQQVWLDAPDNHISQMEG
ncbi:protein-L-isoaspartate(D-aspartate) O-methyltransferase [Lipingzhangella halophila]|uniref:Protein-L-isoaspartate O-methyltransferase n=1 Tax=Lipingzhangella halophila TaxID=1783352 RepID=A0A7W7W552_9ACTN|nr:methyltransferase domain-containing protein [Lipingzhangella halophila]MBB4933405.1 protein-L-isoaspartate(D-aspartate) O-methyltransferase [Lipingzhangella halophila]